MSSSTAPTRPTRRRLARLTAWVALAIVVAAGAVAALLWFAPFLRVEQVEYRTDPSRMGALQQAAPVTKGEPLVQVDTSRVRDAALSTRLFSAVTVSRAWPSTLVVEATPRVPVVAVTGPGVTGFHLVDADGVAFETVSSVPDGVQSATTADPKNPTMLRALASVVAGLTPDLRTSVEQVRMNAAGTITLTVDDVDVTWGDASDSRLKTAVVRDLVEREGVARIDVSAPMAPVTSADRDTAPTTPAGQAATRSPGSSPSAPSTRGTRTPRTGGGTGTPSAASTDEADSTAGTGARESGTRRGTPTDTSSRTPGGSGTRTG